MKGNIVIPFVYEELFQMELDGIIKAKKEGKYGYVNYKNEVLVKFEYDFVNYPNFGAIAVKRNKKFGFVNTQGKEIVPCVYDTVYQFEKNGKATVIKNGNWGYVLQDGTEKISK